MKECSISPFIDQLNAWYSTAFGQRILKAEQQVAAKLLEDRFGFYAVEFASAKKPQFVGLSPMTHKFSLNAQEVFLLNQVQNTIADYTELPFLPESIDLVILPHILEFIAHPEQLLQEIRTCLIPNGYVLALSFNPYSLWGICRWFQKKEQAPFKGKYFSHRRLTHLLETYDFVVDESSVASFDLPFTKTDRQWQHNLSQVLGNFAAPSSANVNLLLARKTVGALTPIKMAWDKRAWRKTIIEPGA